MSEDRDISTLYAGLATDVADRLKPGTYDAVQGLALVSIAHSLARIAAVLEHRNEPLNHL